jgi:hypothetical protein
VDPVEGLLKKQLLDPKQTMLETQAYTGARVAVLPHFRTAAEWQTYATGLRQAILDNIIYRGAAREWRDATTRVEWMPNADAGPGIACANCASK